MMKIFSKKLWTILISSSLAGAGIVWACADGDWEEYGTSNFTPEVFADHRYSPFFYSNLFYYEINYDNAHDTRFNEANVADWSAYFDNTIPAAELTYLLGKAPASTIDSTAGYITGKVKAVPAGTASFKLVQNKSNKNTVAFISYLALAKKAEGFAVNNLAYSWDYESRQNKPSGINIVQLTKDLQQGFINATHPFLKQRYWFQLERAYFFNSTPQSVITLFENNEAKFPKNILYYRCLAYAAGAYYKLKNYSKANYYYSLVYDGCDALKTVAHYSFHPQEEKDWKATLALCRNNDEQATLWQMLGIFYTDAERAMQAIYQLNPKSEKLDLLLTRAVNAAEQSFSTNGTSTQKKDTSNKSLQVFVARIADAANTNKPYMWQMAAGYLNMLSGNFARAKAYYAQANKTVPADKLTQSQLRLLKLINAVSAANKVNTKLENELLPDLQWLSTGKPVIRHEDAFTAIKNTLAHLYKKQQEYIKSECFQSNTAFYTADKNVEAMKCFLDKTNKSPYEQFYASLYTITKADLLEYQAIRLTYAGKTAEAIARLEQAGTEGTIMPGNPFNGRIQDCHDCDHAAAQKIKYSKLNLLRKMKEMQDKIAAGNEAYNNALLLANVYYNITHYGNARAFYECKIIGEYHYSPFSIDSSFEKTLTDMKLATYYYTAALNAAQNDEQKAKCHYMLAKCERNQWYNASFYTNRDSEYDERQEKRDFIAWNGFKALQQYANTQFYKEVIRECGYFKTYAGNPQK